MFKINMEKRRDPTIALAELSGATRCCKYNPDGRPSNWNPHYTIYISEWLSDSLAYMTAHRRIDRRAIIH